ncbi:MAG: hypothetical protein ACHQTE_02520 [Candidatus Saccharimonadales bacterium]
MSIFVQATDAPRYENGVVTGVSLVLAGIFAVMAVAQLFTYEDFPAALSGYWLLGGQVSVHLVAALLVTFEVFTLPFLLRMRVSPLMRLMSLAFAWLAAAVWLVLSLWVVTTTNALTNAGLLGATVRLTPGWWQVVFSVALLALVGFITRKQRSTLVMRHRTVK